MKTVARSVLAGLPQGRLAGPERNFTGAEMQRLHLKCGICRPVRLQGGTRRTMSRAAGQKWRLPGPAVRYTLSSRTASPTATISYN